MTKKNITIKLDGRTISACDDETIWQIARRLGIDIPHLCYAREPGYRADGNCRACMVEVTGERALSASCIRRASDGMVVTTDSFRARKARKMVFELLCADMPKCQQSPDPQAKFWQWAKTMEIGHEPRYPQGGCREIDLSNPAIAVNLDACIACGLCVRACREVQHNDVIGMALRGGDTRPVFDIDDHMAASTCVTCGECVQACPTGALFEKNLLKSNGRAFAELIPDKIVESICPYCGVGCRTKVAVKDNRIIAIDGANGPANENRLCVKGRFGYDYINHPERLTVPLIRRDDAPKNPKGKTFEDRFEVFRKASWQEALAFSASGFNRILAENGGAALAGFGSAKCSNEEAYLFQKLIRRGFGTNNVDHCARLCHASSVAALMEGIGSGAVTAPFTTVENAQCMIVIGARPAQNHPVAATYIKDAANSGVKLYVMDPRYQDLARYGEMVQFNPGCDVALLNSLINVIIGENLINHNYIARHVSGFDDLAASVKRFTPEAMAPITGIAPARVREIARTYANAQNSIILWGMGVTQHSHGTDNVRALIALALITGQIGRPGTGLHPLRGQNNVQGTSDVGLLPMTYPNYQSVEDSKVRSWFEDFWGGPLDPNNGLTMIDIIHGAYNRQIKGMYIMGENPAMSDPDGNYSRDGLARLEHLVVQDIFLTETAWYADVILPATAHGEKLGSYTNSNRQIQIGRPVVSPPGEAHEDWRIIVDLANAMGLDWHYGGGVRDVYREMTTTMTSLNNITWERLEDEGHVTYPAPEPNKPGCAVLFGDGFPTNDRRGHIVPTELLPPAETPDEQYPFVLTTGRLLEHWHTGAISRRAKILNEIEPEAIAAMNPGDVKRLKLEAGKQIQVTTRRGNITLGLRVDGSLPEGMIFIPFCFAEAAANILTNPVLDPFGKIPEFKYCAAAVQGTN